jgi:hypothetical protein
MKKYNNAHYDVLYCPIHQIDHYNPIGYQIFDIKSEKINQLTYAVVNSNGLRLCYYRGCEGAGELKKLHDGYFCVEHAKEMTKLSLDCVNKPNSVILNIKIKEFNYRKVLSLKNYSDIKFLEKELNTDRFLCSRSSINLIHYKYIYDNYNYLKSKDMLTMSTGTEGTNTSSGSRSATGSPSLGSSMVISKGSSKNLSERRSASLPEIHTPSVQFGKIRPPEIKLNKTTGIQIKPEYRGNDVPLPASSPISHFLKTTISGGNSNSYFHKDPIDFVKNPIYNF